MRTFLIVLAVIVVVTSAIFLYFWHRAGLLPEWYDREGWEEARQQAETTAERLHQRVGAAPPGELTLTLTDEEVGAILWQNIASRIKGDVPGAIKGLRVQIQRGVLKAEVVVNLSRLPAGALPKRARRVQAKLLQTFDFLGRGEVYFRITGHHKIEDGHLALDRKATVSIGDLDFTLERLAHILGVEDLLDKKIKVGFDDRLSIEKIILEDDEAVLVGRIQS